MPELGAKIGLAGQSFRGQGTFRNIQKGNGLVGRQFREPSGCDFGEVFFVIVSFFPKTSNERAERLKEFHEYVSPNVKSSVWLLRGRSSTQAPAIRRFALNPCAVRSGIPQDRSQVDGGQARLSRGDLRHRPLGFARTTIQEHSHYLPVFQ